MKINISTEEQVCQQPTDNRQISIYTHAAWLCAYTALYYGLLFSPAELEVAKNRITQHFLQQQEVFKSYIAFCERVLQARQYILNGSNRYVPFPSVWLDPQNSTGFSGTAEWHSRLQQQRKAAPLFRIEWKALAEAILEMIEEGTNETYQYWCSYFIERKALSELSLFRQATAENKMCKASTTPQELPSHPNPHNKGSVISL